MVLPHVNPAIRNGGVGKDRLIDHHFVGFSVVDNAVNGPFGGGMHPGNANIDGIHAGGCSRRKFPARGAGVGCAFGPGGQHASILTLRKVGGVARPASTGNLVKAVVGVVHQQPGNGAVWFYKGLAGWIDVGEARGADIGCDHP